MNLDIVDNLDCTCQGPSPLQKIFRTEYFLKKLPEIKGKVDEFLEREKEWESRHNIQQECIPVGCVPAAR